MSMEEEMFEAGREVLQPPDPLPNRRMVEDTNIHYKGTLTRYMSGSQPHGSRANQRHRCNMSPLLLQRSQESSYFEVSVYANTIET